MTCCCLRNDLLSQMLESDTDFDCGLGNLLAADTISEGYGLRDVPRDKNVC